MRTHHEITQHKLRGSRPQNTTAHLPSYVSRAAVYSQAPWKLLLPPSENSLMQKTQWKTNAKEPQHQQQTTNKRDHSATSSHHGRGDAIVSHGHQHNMIIKKSKAENGTEEQDSVRYTRWSVTMVMASNCRGRGLYKSLNEKTITLNTWRTLRNPVSRIMTMAMR
jgi:hypothetical protein